ncbi:MAG: hypothetical protein H7840_02490 [Alphaproteobacteria bacterium]
MKEENKKFYDKLVEFARHAKVATYSDVAPIVNLDMRYPDHVQQISAILCDISVSEHNNGRPLLSAVIVSSVNGQPGGLPGMGFFTMAEALGFDVSDRVVFFATELRRVHEYWHGK